MPASASAVRDYALSDLTLAPPGLARLRHGVAAKSRLRFARRILEVGSEVALGWKAKYDFEAGLEQTLRWYLDHESWWGPIRARRYAGQRLGSA